MNAARKTMQKTSPRVYTVYSIQYMFSYLHIWSVGLHRHWITWIAAFNKISRRKKTRRIKIRDTTFWTCFRFGPQCSESVLFCRFPTLFRRFLSSEFSVSPCFSWFTFVLFHDNHLCRIHFRCLLDRCCKCQKATNNSSETAFCGQWQSRWQILATQKLRPQF